MTLSDITTGSTGLWGLFVSAFISSTLAPGGSEVVLALLVTAREHPISLLITLATVGNTLGAMTTWYLGALVARRWPSDDPLDTNRHRAVLTLRKYGHAALFFTWLPVVGDALCFAAGWLNLSIPLGTLVILTGKLIRYIVVAYLALQI